MIIYSIGNILASIIYTKKETKSLLFANTIPGLFAIIIGFFAIKYYAIEGACFTFISTYVLSGMLNSYTVIKTYKKTYKNSY
jgi:O-antigen/teichoic acid export membrane protein